MFPRLAEQYRCLVQDLVISLEALARSLQQRGLAATCYSCGDGREGSGASFVANLGTNHMVRFLVSDFGISWVESRDGHELVKLEGADAIQELQRVAQVLQEQAPNSAQAEGSSDNGVALGTRPRR
jgi:hypothetical protein